MLERKAKTRKAGWDLPCSRWNAVLAAALDHLHKAVRETLKLSSEFAIHSLRQTFLTRLGEAGAGKGAS